MLSDKRNISAIIKVKAVILKQMHLDFRCFLALPQNTLCMTAFELPHFLDCRAHPNKFTIILWKLHDLMCNVNQLWLFNGLYCNIMAFYHHESRFCWWCTISIPLINGKFKARQWSASQVKLAWLPLPITPCSTQGACPKRAQKKIQEKDKKAAPLYEQHSAERVGRKSSSL